MGAEGGGGRAAGQQGGRAGGRTWHLSVLHLLLEVVPRVVLRAPEAEAFPLPEVRHQLEHL